MQTFAPSEKSKSISAVTAQKNRQQPFFAPVKVLPKLTIGAVDDPFEREADAMADRVMRMPEQQDINSNLNINRTAFFSPNPITTLNIQRECATCEKEKLKRKEEKLQMKSAGDASAANEAPSIVHDVINNGGQPLDTGTRNFFEPRFGHDFSHVKIHTGSKAAESSHAVSAHAYTSGNNIVFNEGKFTPKTEEGKRLLAHELSHIVQQNDALSSKQISRSPEEDDPLYIIAGYSQQTISAMILDRGSRRVRFITRGGTHYDGSLTTIASGFANGEYLAKRSDSKDPRRTWDLFNLNNTIYSGGMQFSVVLNETDFSTLSYTNPVSITLGESLLSKLVDIGERIKAIAAIAYNSRVGTDDELQIIRLLSDIPIEQSKEFMSQLSTYEKEGTKLLDRLDSVIDAEENVELHEALSVLRLKGQSESGAKNLAQAPIMAWHDVMGFFEQSATFNMEKLSNGKIAIRYLGAISSGMYNNPEYKEIADINIKERLTWMTSGVEVDPDQAIIIHDYDRDRFVVLTAQDLIAYQHSGVRNFLERVATIASFAIPVTAAESVAGRVFVLTMERMLPAMVLVVEENKLNIKRWFPNWGPAIIQATEIVKIGIAVYGVAQFVKGGWQAFQKLKQIKAARKAMDAATIAKDADELRNAEMVALQLEKQGDELVTTAEKLRKEINPAESLASEAASSVGADVGTTSSIPTSQEVLKSQQAELFKGISPDTETLFNTEKGKSLKKLLEQNPDVALFVKLCKSPCFPDLNEGQIGKIRALIRRADIHSISLNENVFKQALHGKSPEEIENILQIVESDLTRRIEKRIPLLPSGPSTMESAEQLRNSPGMSHGGDNLKYIKGKWIEEGKVGFFPKQIADKMRGKVYQNFKAFREEFWKLVAADPNLSPLGPDGKSLPGSWSESNLIGMRKGDAPRVNPLPDSGRKGKLTLELDHRLALKNEGGVYDLDNIEILHKEFHEAVGEK